MFCMHQSHLVLGMHEHVYSRILYAMHEHVYSRILYAFTLFSSAVGVPEHQ
jgi:hypothetical protein